MVKFLICLEFMLVQGVRYRSNLEFPHWIHTSGDDWSSDLYGLCLPVLRKPACPSGTDRHPETPLGLLVCLFLM